MKRNDQPTQQPTPGDIYTAAATADHEARCTNCRNLTAARTAFAADLAASTARVDRYTLGLHRTMRPTAVTL